MSRADAEIRRLWRARPRSRLARLSALALLALVVYAWTSGAFGFATLTTDRALRNVSSFLTEIRPYPLQGRAWDWGVARDWAAGVLGESGGDAVLATLAMSVASIVLAGVLALLASLTAARNLASPEPFLPSPKPPSFSARAAWGVLVWCTRLLLIVVRAVPEYVWAFILLTLLGLSAWPGVLALALHNTGILGKLFAEVVENTDPRPPRALRGIGASRLTVAATAIWPAALNRFLLFFFYRWETCVREATVLGLLGFGGLGFYILQAQGALRYDELLLFVLLGVALIVGGDVVSMVARGVIRRAR